MQAGNSSYTKGSETWSNAALPEQSLARVGGQRSD